MKVIRPLFLNNIKNDVERMSSSLRATFWQTEINLLETSGDCPKKLDSYLLSFFFRTLLEVSFPRSFYK